MQNQPENYQFKSSSIILKNSCKICFNPNSNESNPLISPCLCSGSVKYIHFNCLKEYIQINMNKTIENQVVYFNWKTYACEICLAKYPKYILFKDRRYTIVDLDIEFSSYILFDYSVYDEVKRRSFSKGAIAIEINNNLNSEVISFGRTSGNDVRFKDISVSRNHLKLTREGSMFFIENVKAKFGTLKLITKSMLSLKNEVYSTTDLQRKFFILNSKTYVNIGKHVMTFEICSSKWNDIKRYLVDKITCCAYYGKGENNLDDEDADSREYNIHKVKGINKHRNYTNGVVDSNNDFLTKSGKICIEYKDNESFGSYKEGDSLVDYLINVDSLIRCDEKSFKD